MKLERTGRVDSMMIGDPYVFSLGWVPVSAWVSAGASMNLFLMYVGGRLVSGEYAEPQSIGAQLNDLKGGLKFHEAQRKIPRELEGADEKIFSWLIDLTFPVSIDQKGSHEFLAAPYCAVDKKEVVFLMHGVQGDVIYHGTIDGRLKSKVDTAVGVFSQTVINAWNAWIDFEK